MFKRISNHSGIFTLKSLICWSVRSPPGTGARPRAVNDSVKVTWEVARDWIQEFSNERLEDLDNIQSEPELFNFLKDGKILCRILMRLSQQEIKIEHE